MDQNKSEMTQMCAVALGSNLSTRFGSTLETIQAALKALESEAFLIRHLSRFYRTPAFPVGAGPDFVNACATFETPLPAQEILAHLHNIEREFGRERGQRWSARTLDLDLMYLGDTVAPDRKTVETWMNLPPELQSQTAPKEMILPHPRLHERAFVLVPLEDVAADWMHPVLGKSVARMRADLPPYLLSDVTPID